MTDFDPMSDAEIIDMMKNAAYRLCDEAMSKWWRGEYLKGDDETIRRNVKRWRDAQERLGGIAKKMKASNPPRP